MRSPRARIRTIPLWIAWHPDFIHTGTFANGSMGGTVATRLDLSQSPLSVAGIVNLIGEWEAVRE